MRRIILRSVLSLAGVSTAFGLCGCQSHGKVRDHEPPAAASVVLRPPPHPDRIEISEKGFAPSHVIVENAQPLVFRRTTDKGCATAVIFPQFRIEEPLPLDTDVSIVLPPTASGEVAFQCGVGENRGKVVASVAGS